jgi:hypothetical protein
MIESWKDVFVATVALLCITAVLSVGLVKCTGCRVTEERAAEARYLKCIEAAEDVRECGRN